MFRFTRYKSAGCGCCADDTDWIDIPNKFFISETYEEDIIKHLSDREIVRASVDEIQAYRDELLVDEKKLYEKLKLKFDPR